MNYFIACRTQIKSSWGLRGKQRGLVNTISNFASAEDLELEQLDDETTFLHGELEKEIYMAQPDGFQIPGKVDFVCQSKKYLDGLKQSLRQWYKRFDRYMIEIGYARSPYDSCIYCNKVTNRSFMYLVLYVNDIIIATWKKYDIQKLKGLLSAEFEMKDLGVARKILGVEISPY